MATNPNPVITSTPNDGLGDTLFDSFTKTNSSFDDVYLAGPVGSNIEISGNTLLSANVNGDINITPNGTGAVNVTNLTFVSDVDLNSNKILNLATPTDPADAVNKDYVDVAVATGIGDPNFVGENILATPLAAGPNSLATGDSAVSVSYGQKSFASGEFAVPGDAQQSTFVCRVGTSNDTPTLLAPDGGTLNLMILPDDTAWAYNIQLVARDTEFTKYIIIDGLIKQTGGTVSAVGLEKKEVIAEENGPVPYNGSLEWDASIIANDTDKALEISVIGNVGQDIKWVAVVNITEVTG